MAENFYQKRLDPPVIEIRSKDKKGLVVKIFRDIRTYKGVEEVNYRTICEVSYFNKAEGIWKRKYTLFYQELVEMTKLMIHAVRWISQQSQLPFPFTYTSNLEDVQVTDYPIDQASTPEESASKMYEERLNSTIQRHERLEAKELDDDLDIPF